MSAPGAQLHPPQPWDWRCTCGAYVCSDEGHSCTVLEQPTLRDRMAMAALAGIWGTAPWDDESAATRAYAMADAMLAARERHAKP